MNGRHLLRLPNKGMYFKPYKAVDHYPTNYQFLSMFYQETNIIIEQTSKNRAKIMYHYDRINRSGDLDAREMNKVKIK